jgi:hypothetical protein
VRYFTPELIALLNSSDDAVADEADAEWDRRLAEYEEGLRRLTPDLPEHVREFNDVLLHDARVLSLARRESQLIMVLHKDIPPRDVVIITYTLAGEPVIDTEALPLETRSPVMKFDYDEFGVTREGDRTVYTQSILFSNGWEVGLRFHDVRVVLAEPVFPSVSIPGQRTGVA